MLHIAKSIGLNIPRTLITSSKKELFGFKENVGDIIVKPISEVFYLMEEKRNEYAMFYTSIVSDEDIKLLPNTFVPTKFQE